jgi:hypothetical protein
VFKALLLAHFFNEPRLLMVSTGLFVSLLTWRRHRKVSAIAASGFGFLVLAFLGRVATSYIKSAYLHETSHSPLLALVPLSAGLAEFAGWLFIIIAVFIARPKA